MGTIRSFLIAVGRSTTTRRVLRCVAACTVNIVVAEPPTQVSAPAQS